VLTWPTCSTFVNAPGCGSSLGGAACPAVDILVGDVDARRRPMHVQSIVSPYSRRKLELYVCTHIHDTC
jgi:hypothetical protein